MAEPNRLTLLDRVTFLITGSVELGDLLAAAREEDLASLRRITIQKMPEGVTTCEEVVAMTG
jgi:type II secretory ATPase GspE/PulE/Tfp pilus assembly ATPase PilB-like protein